MKAWSAALAAELSGWPQVTVRPFFGFNALYRKTLMFAVLPKTRAWGNGNSLAFKVESPSSSLRGRIDRDSRIGCMDMQKSRWFTLQLSSDRDLHDAIEWLAQAYRAAAKSASKPKKSK